jgi:flagella basal body P-ring formation protein FlgA
MRVKRFFLLASMIIWYISVCPFGPKSLAEESARDSIEVSKEHIRQVVVRFLERNHPWKKAEVRVRDVRIPGRILLPTSLDDLSIRVPPNTRYLGHTPLEVALNRGRIGEKRFWVNAYLEVLSPVVITKKPMARNQIISADDVVLEKRDLAKVPPGAITNVEEVVGQRVKRTLRVGIVLRTAFVDKPIVVRRGDVVRLLVDTERLTISALGRVDERGGVGDTVRVINLDSMRRVYGQVVDSRTIRVRY